MLSIGDVPIPARLDPRQVEIAKRSLATEMARRAIISSVRVPGVGRFAHLAAERVVAAVWPILVDPPEEIES